MIDRRLCPPGFGYFQAWRCPVCGAGTLGLGKDMIRHWPAAGVAWAIETFARPFGEGTSPLANTARMVFQARSEEAQAGHYDHDSDKP
jgi:hypothetical protein